MSNDIQKLIKHSKDPDFIQEVLEFAKNTYNDTQWLFGQDYYINHTVRIALLLNEMGLDQKIIAAGLLYNAVNLPDQKEKNTILKEIEKKFGSTIKELVEKTSELNRIYYALTENANIQELPNKEKTENVIKMFLAIAKDLRVILIKIASRIDGLYHIKTLPVEKQKPYATETLHIFVPLTSRLGLGKIKVKLEDPAFEILFPDKFSWLQENLKEKYEERQKYLERFMPRFKKILKHEKIPFLDIHYRAKSYWSTYQKLERHNMNFEKLHDLVAMKVIVKDISTCYKVLGIIHKYYQPLSGQIQDYIAKPKENGYQSLHTTVLIEKNKISEIQIKTEQMHKEAEHGICAHWAYKEKFNLRSDKETLTLSRQVPEFWKNFKIDFFENQIFTSTPKGDIITLPNGSTPIDFAYAIHSDIGNHCESAKIGGKIVPLSQELKNGDVIEIITNKKKRPSYDWLGFVKTNFAKSHIKKITSTIIGPIFSVPSILTKKIFGKSKTTLEEKTRIKKTKLAEIYLAGQKDMLINIAKCCSPTPNDQVKAYLAKYRAAVLHKTSCQNFQKLAQNFPEKIVDATWQQD